MEDSRSIIAEKMIDENRLSNLPRTIKKYTKLMENALHVLDLKPYNQIVVNLWVPKSVEEAMIYKINEKHIGYFARVKTSGEYDSIIEIISLDKLDRLERNKEYMKIRKKVLKRSKFFWNSTTNVPKTFIKALDLDLELNEKVDCLYDEEDINDDNDVIQVTVL